MAHYDIDQLADYILGRASSSATGRVRGHLSSGCERCNRLAALVIRLQRIGRFDACHQPPAGTVRTVKALFSFGRPAEPRRRISMRLSFDSLLQPAMAGIRSQRNSTRHLVYYSQNFALDLRMDYEHSIRDMILVGQLLNRDWGPLPDVPTYLMADDRVLSHATTGRLGEFHMEFEPGSSMQLRFFVNDEELIEVELDRRRQGEPRPTLYSMSDLNGLTLPVDKPATEATDRPLKRDSSDQ